VGRIVGDLVRTGRVAREAIVVVSKIGYVQGQNLALAQERAAAGRPFPEMVHYQPGCWHCIHPEFLEDQLARSLDRLDLETLDVCLLHNPEYFLSEAAHRGDGKLETVRDEFYRRLAAALRFFEEQVGAGKEGPLGPREHARREHGARRDAAPGLRRGRDGDPRLAAACRSPSDLRGAPRTPPAGSVTCQGIV